MAVTSGNVTITQEGGAVLVYSTPAGVPTDIQVQAMPQSDPVIALVGDSSVSGTSSPVSGYPLSSALDGPVITFEGYTGDLYAALWVKDDGDATTAELGFIATDRA